MSEARPNFCDDVLAYVDVIEVHRFYLVVRNQATGQEHSFSYDNILIGSTDRPDRYELMMPAWLAQMEGIADAR